MRQLQPSQTVVEDAIDEDKTLSVRALSLQLDIEEIRRVKPASLEELKEVVNNFCESLDPDEVRKAVRHIRRRAQACFEAEGGHFEHKLKKKNNNLEE